MDRARRKKVVTLEDLLERTEVNPATGCRLWTGYTTKSGYGYVRFQGQPTPTHRVAWILAHGEPPEATPHVLHHCDKLYPVDDFTNRRCVNTEHLWLGTMADNNRDMIAKGRAHKVDGEAHPNSKFTEAVIAEMRASDKPNTYWAALLGVNESNVSRARRGKSWRGSHGRVRYEDY